ncbi:MAG: Ig-like domain-containing protein [Limisphaerales bacterium]
MTSMRDWTTAGWRRLLTLTAWLGAAGAMQAANVTLSWNPSPGPGLAGYYVHYGTASRTYPNRFNVGPAATSTVISNLPAGQTYYFAITATNAAGDESVFSEEVFLAIPAVNHPPQALAQSVTTPEDVARTITLTGSDADNDPLTFAIVTPPTNGTLTGTPPNVTYRPATNFFGSDSFTFRVSDGKTNSAPATVSITVTPVNDRPVALAQSITTLEDTPVAVTLAGFDVDGDPLTFLIVAQPTKGTLSGTPPNLLYTPNPNANGADSFTFRVNDGLTNSATATVSISITPVNDAPVAIAQSVTTDRNVARAITLTGSDVDGDPLTYTLLTQPTLGTLSGTPPNLTYTPNNNVTGNDSFTFRVNDGTVNSAAATVSITILPGANQPPVALSQSVTNAEDTALPITLAGTDPEGAPLQFTILTPPTNGVLTGTAPNVTYRPNTNFFGGDSFTFRVSDGQTNSAPATVSIIVTPVNDPPTLEALASLTLTAGAPAVSVNLAGITSGAANENDTLNINVVSSAAHIVAVSGITYASPATAGSFQLTPVSVGTATLTVTVNDGKPTNNLVVRTFNVTVVAPESSAPTVALTSPTSGSAYTAPVTLTLTASVNPNSNTIHRVEFWAGTNWIGQATNAPYQVDWSVPAINADVPVLARVVYGPTSQTLSSVPAVVRLTTTPAPWEPLVVAAKPLPGEVAVTNNTYNVLGAGVLNGPRDSFQFVRQSLLGDGSLTLRLDAVQSTNAAARMGIMIRESLTDNSRYVFLGVSPDGLIRWQTRTRTGGSISSSFINPRTGPPANLWLRLTREGGSISGYRSTDGVNWTRMNRIKLDLAPNIHMGFTVSSGNLTTPDRAVFSNAAAVP